ncbi:phosphate ABC transporter, permease protein PstA, partial [Actinomyces urogenitalis]|nr:phosphate ABC transporter, permease protein PstA [Actinomyces urogenitalis]
GLILFFLVIRIVGYAVEGPRRGANRMATVLITSAFALAVLPLLSLLYTVIVEDLPVLSYSVLNNSTLGMSLPGAQPGLGHAIVGTL